MMTGMGLFSSDDKKDADRETAVAELARIESMPLRELAEEIMTRVWGRAGLRDAYATAQGETGVAPYEIFSLFAASATASSSEEIAITEAVEEGIQLLEHGGLVVLRVGGGDIVKPELRPTRAGLRAIDAGDIRSRLPSS